MGLALRPDAGKLKQRKSSKETHPLSCWGTFVPRFSQCSDDNNALKLLQVIFILPFFFVFSTIYKVHNQVLHARTQIEDKNYFNLKLTLYLTRCLPYPHHTWWQQGHAYLYSNGNIRLSSHTDKTFHTILQTHTHTEERLPLIPGRICFPVDIQPP